MSGVRLAGFGHHAPGQPVPNATIEAAHGLEPGWIARRTGIAFRHIAGASDTVCGLATRAALPAVAAVDPDAVGLLLLATSTPDRRLPPTAPALALALGLRRCAAMDLAGACTGFLHALVLADGFVRAHRRPAVVVAANILSRRIAPGDAGCAALFADAAGAVALCPDPDPGRGVRGLDLATDGSGGALVEIPPGGDWMRIGDGRALFARAAAMMTASSQAALRVAGIQADAVSRFVPHQANRRITDRVAAELGLADRMWGSIDRFGNSSAATIPLTLALAHQGSPIRDGETLLFAAAGAGLTGGAVLWQA